MNWRHHEPTLTEILSDSIVRSLMRADGVDPGELEATLRELADTHTGEWRMRLRAGRKSGCLHSA